MAEANKKQFIQDLRPRDQVDSLFRVKNVSLMQARDGRDYLNMVVSDSTGDLECRAWQNAGELSARFQKGEYVQLTGKVNQYQGKRQLIIQDVREVGPDAVNPEDFIMKSKNDPDKMFEELLGHVQSLDDHYIKELLTLVLQNQDVASRLKMWPAGKSIHHAYQSGLLEHVLSCVGLSFYLSDCYQMNKNYVVAGAILHDLCKVYELTDGMTEYTDEGKLVGHLSKGSELVERFASKIPRFPSDLKMHLKHILLSHHGFYEYGSPKIPQTPEAMLLHLIDMMDSKMNAFKTAIQSDQQAGDWTGYIKHLDRIVYKAPLPFYPHPVADKKARLAGEETKKGPTPPKRDKYQQQAPKKNLGALLGPVKVSEE